MTELLNAAAQIVIPMAGLTGALCVAGGLEYLWEVYNGYAPMPYRMSRRYWRRKFVRLVCRLAAIEAAWEKRKAPRKAATKRGTVGQRVRRSACIYTTIVPQSSRDVKGDFRVEWNWMRG